MSLQFEPFQDRLSRDIRNDLAAAMGAMLEEQDIGPVQKVADRYLDRALAPWYREYIVDRLQRYRSVLEVLRPGPADSFWQALVLWDQQLFFEVHEVLEHAWLTAAGAEKQILQAMIRAAGVYVKLEYGYPAAAGKMAGRALPVLQKNRDFLARYFEPELLMRPLAVLDPNPPRLLSLPT